MKFLKSPKFWLIIIIITSAFFRLYRIGDYMEFLGDQGRDVVVVRNFLTKGDPIAIGPQTSIGNMYLGPWFYYLIAPALLFANFSPIGPSVLVALLGIATTYLIYLLTKAIFDQKSGLFAALIFSISPVAIKYTSFSWNPNIMPFFAILFVYSIYYVSKGRFWYLVAASLSFIMCLNAHYLCLLLLPFAAIYCFQGWRLNQYSKNIFKPLLVAVLIFIISLAPQILFDIKHQGQNVKAIITFFTIRQTTVNLKPYKAIPQIVPLLNQQVTSFIAGKDSIVGVILTVFFIITILLLFIFQPGNRHQLIYVATWLFFGLVGLALYKQHIYDHYFGFLYPSLIILFSQIIKKTKVIGLLFLCLIVFASLKENPLRYQPNRQLATVIQISSLINTQSDGQPFNLALIAKQNYDPPYRYILDLDHAPIFTLTQRKTSQLFVVCEAPLSECQPIGHPLWDIAAFGPAQISQQWSIGSITIFRLIPSAISSTI